MTEKDKKERGLGEVYLKDVRLSFPRLFEKTSSVDGGKKKYRANFLIDPVEKLGAKVIKAIEKAKKAVEKEKWDKTPKYKDDRCCFQAGENFTASETGEIYGGYEGMMVLKASGDGPLKLKYKGKGGNLTRDDDDPFYAGCRVDAIVRIYPITNKKQGGTGLFAGLEGVSFRRDDEAFGAPGLSDDAFEEVDDDDEYADDEDDDDDLLD
ncbi:ssDNA-binding protein [Candidatus Halocynthiibacter alkanivorans]|uniref:ssDNA-binding protein n=1 Tax=Candidatus Halocynthiibacter alkanivorans TaxID=2267619 RepID=UPI000DF1912A|nr:ssDNA-binding protein [Candidatus Halocynthiibacter alkanivorans]